MRNCNTVVSMLTAFLFVALIFLSHVGASSAPVSDAKKLADIMGAYEEFGDCPYLYEAINAKALKQLYETDYKALIGTPDKTSLIKDFIIPTELCRLNDYAIKLDWSSIFVLPTYNLKKDKPLDIAYKLLQARDSLLLSLGAQLINAVPFLEAEEKKSMMAMKSKPLELAKALDAAQMKQLIVKEEAMLKSIDPTGVNVVTDSASKPKCRMAALIVDGLKQFSAKVLARGGLFAERLRKEYQAQYLDKNRPTKPLLKIKAKPAPKSSSAMNSEIMSLASELEAKLQKMNPKAAVPVTDAQAETLKIMNGGALGDETKKCNALKPIWEGLCKLDTLVKRVEEGQALVAEIENTFGAKVPPKDQTKLRNFSNQMSDLLMGGGDVKTSVFDLSPVDAFISRAKDIRSTLALKNPSLKNPQEQAVDVLTTSLDTELKSLEALLEECIDQSIDIKLPTGVATLKSLQAQLENAKDNATISTSTKQDILSTIKSKSDSLGQFLGQTLIAKYAKDGQDLVKRIREIDVEKRHEEELKAIEEKFQMDSKMADLQGVRQGKLNLEQLLAKIESEAKAPSLSSSSSSLSSSNASSSSLSSSSFDSSSSPLTSSSSTESSASSTLSSSHQPESSASSTSSIQSNNESSSASMSSTQSSSITDISQPNPLSTDAAPPSGKGNSWLKWVIWISVVVIVLVAIALAIVFVNKKRLEEQGTGD